MRELGVQTRNGTYAAEDRTNADYEFQALKSEINRISQVTTFNRKLIGTSGAAADGFTFFVGSDPEKAGNKVRFLDPTSVGVTASGLDITGVDNNGTAVIVSISTTDSASAAVVAVDTALNSLAGKRAHAGALVNRLEHTVANLMNVSQRLQEAVSGIEDADYAAESANLARGMVLQQAGTAMLAQANQSPQYILTLLK